MKRILITGAGSYIGTSVEDWLKQSQFAGMYQVDTVDMRDEQWKEKDFHGYDTIFHVAGIAHADTGTVTEKQKKQYYRINCDLAMETAAKAKENKVKQFIYMSSIIVYGEGSSIKKKRVITRDTEPSPSSFYGDSKWRAEQELQKLCDGTFRVDVLRPPMIYGYGCKGNYPLLSEIARKTFIFPDISNERSMLHIDNLCEFVRLLVEYEGSSQGVFFPQNAEYVNTSELVKRIAGTFGRKIILTSCMNWAVFLLSKISKQAGGMIHKAFGSLVYEKEISKPPEGFGDYQIIDFSQSIQFTEKGKGR